MSEPLDMEAIRHGDTRENINAMATGCFRRASLATNESQSKHESAWGFMLAKALEERAWLIAEVDRLRAENERLKQNVYLLETTVDDLKRARRIIDAETKKANGRDQ